MTTDQKREVDLAIAEAMGWRWWKYIDPRQSDSFFSFERPGYDGSRLNGVIEAPTELDLDRDDSVRPLYCDDLNACAEFRKTLTGAECLEYVRILNEVTKHMAHITAFPMIDATPEQHSETFCRLRKIGPWKE